MATTHSTDPLRQSGFDPAGSQRHFATRWRRGQPLLVVLGLSSCGDGHGRAPDADIDTTIAAPTADAMLADRDASPRDVLDPGEALDAGGSGGRPGRRRDAAAVDFAIDAGTGDAGRETATERDAALTADAAEPVGLPSEAVDAGPDWALPKDVRPPRLTHDVVDLSGAYDADTGRLGDLLCAVPPSRPAEAQRACFTPSGLHNGGFVRLVVVEHADVHAATAGRVSSVEADAVVVRLAEDSAYWLEYRHLTDIQLAVGDEVAAGDLLGRAARHHDDGFGLVAWAVRHREHVLQRVCPERYGEETFVAHLTAARQASNAAWPTLAWDAACETGAVVCADPSCVEDDLASVFGDVDLGRLYYKNSCQVCHGKMAEGVAAPGLVSCTYCGSPRALADRTTVDMPPGGLCDPQCAADVSAFIFYEFH